MFSDTTFRHLHTMYPGLDGLAQSINYLRNLSYENVEGCPDVIR